MIPDSHPLTKEWLSLPPYWWTPWVRETVWSSQTCEVAVRLMHTVSLYREVFCHLQPANVPSLLQKASLCTLSLSVISHWEQCNSMSVSGIWCLLNVSFRPLRPSQPFSSFTMSCHSWKTLIHSGKLRLDMWFKLFFFLSAFLRKGCGFGWQQLSFMSIRNCCGRIYLAFRLICKLWG